MNDTHRTPVDQVTGRIGEFDGPPAPVARPTGADSGAGTESGPTLWREVDALGGSLIGEADHPWNEAILAVLAILERRGFTEAADMPRDSGKFGAGAAFHGFGRVDAPSDETASSGDPSASEADRASIARVADRLWHGIPLDETDGKGLGIDVEATGLNRPLDPTPEEQRERFRAIAATPKPSAVDIRSALVTAEFLAGHWEEHGLGGNAEDTRHVAGMLDRLGVEVVTLELERDDLRRQLDTIAANAQPVDGTDIAELVQRARIMSERMAGNGAYRVPATGARQIIDSLVGAVNDQVRKLREAEPVHVCGCGPMEGDVVGDAYGVLVAWINGGEDPGALAWSNLASRLRWQVLEDRKALATAKQDLADADLIIDGVHKALGLDPAA